MILVIFHWSSLSFSFSSVSRTQFIKAYRTLVAGLDVAHRARNWNVNPQNKHPQDVSPSPHILNPDPLLKTEMFFILLDWNLLRGRGFGV